MSDTIKDQELDLIEDTNEEQLEMIAEDVEVDEELAEAAAKKEAKDEESEAEVEVDDEEGEIEDDEDELEEEQLDELSPKTLDNYETKASMGDKSDSALRKKSRANKTLGNDDEAKRLSKKAKNRTDSLTKARARSLAQTTGNTGEEGSRIDKAARKMPKSYRKEGVEESMEIPSTKAGLIAAMYESLSEMSKDDLTTAYEKLMAEEAEVQEEAVAESVELDVEVNFDEDLEALVSEEANLAEGFKDKAAVIFEAAVKSKLSAEVEKLEESYEEKLAEQVQSVQSDLVEKVDGYLNYVVESWMEQNEVAVTNGLRTEIAENFIQSLQTVFVENYIDVPEAKVDLVDALAENVEELEESLNKAVESNIELTEKVAGFARAEIIREATVGMAETEVEKLRSLTENLDFDDVESFQAKVDTVKESYFKVKNAEVQEELQEGTQEKTVSPVMAAYLKALKSK